METQAALQQLEDFEAAALASIAAASDPRALEAARIEFLGQKKGRLKDLQGLLGKVDPAERPNFGKRFNEAKTRVEAALADRQRQLARPAVASSAIDVTLPGAAFALGRRHPLTQTIDEFKDIMGRFGFSVAEGPEIEDELHNFDALNIPLDHPARDPLENFYVAAAKNAHEAVARSADSSAEQSARPGGISNSSYDDRRGDGGPLLLRSQTSTVQIRVMERTKPPVRIVSVGRVYRPDTIDATHSCMFHQMEGLMVADDVTMAQLKTVLQLFARAYLGHDVGIRFRPSFFPFTEPSVEVDMHWGDGWMEIGGAGMVDPHVLRAVGYDPDEVTGFAFGLGVERFCMKRHGIRDIRLFTENDVRFLRQF